VRHFDCLSDAPNFEAGESRTIEAVVKSEEGMGFPQGVSANHEICKDAARSYCAVPSAASGICLEGLPRGTPDSLI